ncbi:hypothetical protein [uncultured Desulfosarcina sp.]|uniref:hypothetical protein n=1 Tax=uncultured Desulfosarcina sp. TaxID=218289 RepID=UPI0029C7C99C|nr:hypothetical protein [uncultured Desulfosarcina sp.]
MQKAPIVFLLAVLFLFFTQPVIADTAVVYDSGELAISAWHVHLSRHTIELNQPEKGYLNIKKNTPRMPIRAGFLMLNHRMIPITRFLSGPDTTFKKKIKLRRTNRLRVFLIGSPGASVSITVNAGTENQTPPTLDFSAEPETIDAGSSSILSWSSEHTDACTILPDIGAVDTTGSIAVSPAATTAYTLTATGPGGAVSSTVTVTVNLPAPTVTLSAAPLEINRGESATLAWTSTNADSCMISPAIGSVDAGGSVRVSPVETTTYDITATGAGGEATASVTVVVSQPAPTVGITVSPDAIHPGESATLTWNSTDAESCAIEPGIGDVASSGSMTVSPTETTTYTITASGLGGDEIKDQTTLNVNPLSLSITSPFNAQVVSRHNVLVEGIVSTISARETGVVVNGVPAMVFNGRFVANHISLMDGENTISVKATDADGNIAEEAIIVYAETTKNYISLSADAESGVYPLETTLRVNGPLNYLTPSITFTGPDAATFSDTPEEKLYPVKLGLAGIYFFTAEVSDDQGNTYSDKLAIVVLSAEELDVLLKAKWADMKAALTAGDIQHALQFHHERYHEKYTAIYNALGTDLPSLVEQMQDISRICYIDGTAKYRIRQNHDISGQTVSITYYIFFSRGGNGLWLIERY